VTGLGPRHTALAVIAKKLHACKKLTQLAAANGFRTLTRLLGTEQFVLRPRSGSDYRSFVTMMSIVRMIVLAAVAALSSPWCVDAVDPSKIVTVTTAINGEVEDMVWIASNKNIVFLLTDRGIVYRSEDEGMSWTDQTSLLKNAVKDTSKVHDASDFIVARIEPHDLRKDHLIFQGAGKLTWTTANAGKHYVAMANSMTFHEIKMHPIDPHKILASSMSERCASAMAEGFCNKQLFYSSNYGQTWKYLRHFIVQFDWAHKLGAHIPHDINKDAIFFTEANNRGHDQKFGYWDRNIDFKITEDFFVTEHTKVHRGNRFLFTSKYMFIAQVISVAVLTFWFP